MGNVGKATPDVPNQGWGLYIVSVVMVIVSGVFVSIRIGVRVARRMMGMDDWMIIMALISLIFLTLTECLAVVNGYGKHMTDITHEQMILAFKWFYGAQIVYKVAVAFYKLSMLFLYLRIFPGTSFRLVTHVLIAFIVAVSIAFITVTIFQCKPISAFWDKTLLKNPANHCFRAKAFWFSYSVINIVSDVLILLLPISEVIKLQLPRREKVALCGVFSLGIFVCATTIIRTTTLASSADSPDPTWGIIPATIWSVVEANTGTICACLPTLKKPLSLLFPRLFYSSSLSTPAFFDHTPEGEGAYRLEDSKNSKAHKSGSFNGKPAGHNPVVSKEVEDDTWSNALKDVDPNAIERPGSGESKQRLTNPEVAAQMGVGEAVTTPAASKPGILRTTDVDVRYQRESGGSVYSNDGSSPSKKKDERGGGGGAAWIEAGDTWPKNQRASQFHLPRRSEDTVLTR